MRISSQVVYYRWFLLHGLQKVYCVVYCRCSDDYDSHLNCNDDPTCALMSPMTADDVQLRVSSHKPKANAKLFKTRMHSSRMRTAPIWTEFLTHACENITFSQLRLWMVKYFGGHMSFCGATDTPAWTSADFFSGFQSQSGQPYLHFANDKCIVHTVLKLHVKANAFFDAYNALELLSSWQISYCAPITQPVLRDWQSTTSEFLATSPKVWDKKVNAFY